MINTHLTAEMLRNLRSYVLPSQICNLFLQICKPELPFPYSTAFIDKWVESITKDRLDLRTYFGGVLKCYALETDHGSMRQTFCWECSERMVPTKKANGFFAQMFADKPEFSYFCVKCGKGVLAPAVS